MNIMHIMHILDWKVFFKFYDFDWKVIFKFYDLTNLYILRIWIWEDWFYWIKWCCDRFHNIPFFLSKEKNGKKRKSLKLVLEKKW